MSSFYDHEDNHNHDQTGHTALQRAAAEGHVEIVKQLVKQGASVDHQDEVVRQYDVDDDDDKNDDDDDENDDDDDANDDDDDANDDDDVEIVKQLVKQGASVDHQDEEVSDDDEKEDKYLNGYHSDEDVNDDDNIK